MRHNGLRIRVGQERLRMICLCPCFVYGLCIHLHAQYAGSRQSIENSVKYIDDVSERNQANLKMVAKDTQIYDDSQSRSDCQFYPSDRAFDGSICNPQGTSVLHGQELWDYEMQRILYHTYHCRFAIRTCLDLTC